MKIKTNIAIIGICLISTLGSSHAAEPVHKDIITTARMFGSIAPFDANKNSVIDEAETATVTKALSNGTLKLLDAPKGPLGMKPPAGLLSDRLSKAYATLAPFDKNKNATLDDTELKQLQSDVEAGKVTLPFPPDKK